MIPEDRIFVSAETAAKELSITKCKLYRLAKSGKIEAHNFGSLSTRKFPRMMFRASDIAEHKTAGVKTE